MNLDYSRNKVFRYVMIPSIMAFRILRFITYQFSEDSKKIQNLKDIHKGERCFIIGNGPSLKVEDLEMLSQEITFGTNRIYSIFPQTKWRPTYYVAIDNNVIKDNINSIRKVQAKHCFLNITSKYYGMKRTKNTTFINIFSPYLVKPYCYETKHVCKNPSRSFTLSFSVTGIAMELAIYMGFTEIYLLGVDNSYVRSIDKNGEMIMDISQADYFDGLESKSYTIQYSDATNSYYTAFQKYAQEHNLKIYNATRGGKLDVYPRVDLDDILR